MAETQLLFDKLRYMDRLTKAGIAETQARAQAEALEEALRESVATQSFVRGEIATLRYELTVRMGLAAAAIIAILASVKFFG